MDADVFRESRFYNQECEVAFNAHIYPLKMIFEKFSMMNPQAGKARFGIDESIALFGTTKMLGNQVGGRDGSKRRAQGQIDPGLRHSHSVPPAMLMPPSQ